MGADSEETLQDSHLSQEPRPERNQQLLHQHALKSFAPAHFFVPRNQRIQAPLRLLLRQQDSRPGPQEIVLHYL